MEIYIHEDPESYNETMRDEVGGVENSVGNFAFETDANNKPTGKGRIDINLSKANSRTVAHEVSHAIMLKAFGDNPNLFKNFRNRIAKILTESSNKALMDFANQYVDKQGELLDVTYEEYLAELTGALATQEAKLSATTLQKIAALINDIINTITKGKFKPFEDIKDTKEIVDFFNQVASSINKGTAIENINSLGISGTINPTGAKSKSSLSSGEIKRFPVNENVKVEEDVPLSKFKGKKSNLIESDRMTGGYISDSEGNPLFKFFGGVFYPIITGKWWASRNMTKAKAIAENGNKNRDSDGYVYCTPMIGSDKQHMSMISVTVELMKHDVNDKKSKVKKSDVITSIEKAFNRKDVQNKKRLLDSILRKSNSINDIFEELEFALFQEGDKILDRNNNPVLDNNGDPISNFTFEERLAIVNTILGDPKVKDVKFPSAGSISDAAKRFEEPIATKAKAIGDVVTVMRTKGILKYKKTESTDKYYHKSYPIEVYAVDENGNPAEIEVYILDGAYGMKETFPSLTQSSGKVFTWGEYIQKHKSEVLATAQYNRTAKLSSAVGEISYVSKSQKSQTPQIKDYIESQRKAGETDADIRAGIESVADRIGLSKEDIDALMKGEDLTEAPVQENPFENIPKTQVARDKYFDTAFGENADKAREIYNQGGTPAEMLAKMQEAGLEPPVPPTKEKVTLSAEPEKVGIRKEDIKELAIKYDLEIAERREAISDVEIERMAKELIANGYDVNKLVKESLEPEKRPLTDIEANILAEVAADMKAKIDKNSSDADIAKYRDVLSALNKGISENARGLRMAKVKKNVVESIADVMADMMIDMKQDELTTEQRKEAEKRFNDLKDALDKETELRKQAEQEIDRLNAELEIKKQKARAENKPKKSKQDYASERKAIIQSIKDKWNKASKGEGGLTMAVVPYQSQLMAIAPDVAKLVKSYLEQGAATTLEEVRALLKKDIQDVGIDVKDEDVRELIAGNYNKKKPTKNQYAKKLYELKQEEKLLLQIEALERGEEPTTEKKRIEKNQKLKELRDRIKELTGKEAPKREKKEKKEKTEDEKFEQAINARIKANQKKQSEIQDKINRGDFSPEVKKQSILENTELQENNKALYDSYLKSVLDKDEALLEYEKARVADKMKNRGKVEKLADGIDTLLTTSKGTVAMFDQSVFLVQMLPFALSHPLKLAQFAARSMKDFANKKAFDEKMAVLHSSGLWDLIEKSGLAIYEPKTAKAELRNELHGGDKNIWNKDMKIGGYNISPGQAFERATSSALNNARLYLFMNRVQDLNNAGKTFENAPEEFKAAARFANEFTGHGKVQEDIAKATNLLNKFIWSPKMFSSTLNILGLGDITRPVATANAIARRLGIKTKESSKYKGFYTSLTPEQGKFAAKELTRFILGGVTIMYSVKLISMLKGDDEDEVKVDMNPKSSNFGNINVGGKNIAVFGRFASAVRTICQALLSEKTTSTGETKALGEGYGNKTSGEVVFGSFVRGKMTPASGLAYDFFLNNRKNYYTQEKLTASEIAKQSFIPMSARDIIKDFDRDGALIGTLETIAKLYGTSIRDERDFIKAEKPTFTELEMKDEGDKKAFDFLKKYEVPVPVFQDIKKYRLEVDDKHPEAGKTKDGKPYALYSTDEFKMYNDFKKDYIIKALKILNRLDKSGTVKLSKEVIEDKLKSIESQASKVAKNKMIAKKIISVKNKEKTDTDITISEEFAELFSDENPEQ